MGRERVPNARERVPNTYGVVEAIAAACVPSPGPAGRPLPKYVFSDPRNFSRLPILTSARACALLHDVLCRMRRSSSSNCGGRTGTL